ncbi:FAD-dependent oxidoreductase [Paracoccus sp. Z330]|uniref:FAD-dependent oxidoreductase n=1 Tax=Paracoccus onchidii TaxID=3017813 RepID=A0ABT4ZEC5_9RHOB|nr:FAD-dependent oxidoreductase [Paracoccus onchidii]MDB6177703.1 FAD-dependent oxidoreductase [Paracoccus onchidii]
MSTADVLVIGGGLHGLSSALHLARDGADVTVLEGEFVGRHASGASAAGVRTLGRDPREMPLALRSMEMWHQIGDLVSDDCGFHAHGQLRVFETEAQIAAETRRIAELEAHGHTNEQIIGQDTLRQLVPGINPKFIGAAYADRDGAADPHRTLVAFRAAAERAGVRIVEGAPVCRLSEQRGAWRVETAQGAFAAPTVINAAGAWGARVAAMTGESIPLSAKASMMMVTERLTQTIRPVVSIVGRSLSFKQSSQGTLVLGGGIQGRYDLDSGRTAMDFHALARGAAAAEELMPAVKGARIARCWSGIEGKTSDLLPVICPGKAAGIFHIFGFSGHGFQLVPAAGEAMAGMVTTGVVPEIFLPFNAERLTTKGAAA